jgi:hypothetical protein
MELVYDKYHAGRNAAIYAVACHKHIDNHTFKFKEHVFKVS